MICHSCKNGYYLTEYELCEKIEVPNCIESVEGEICIKCEEGYKLYEMNCDGKTPTGKNNSFRNLFGMKYPLVDFQQH